MGIVLNSKQLLNPPRCSSFVPSPAPAAVLARHCRAIERTDNFYFSVPPSIVRSPQKQKLVTALPLERLVLETDAPALGPVKDESNKPANITLSRDEVARIKGVSPAVVELATTANALKLFPRLQRFVKAAPL